jgi:hypothetical protein
MARQRLAGNGTRLAAAAPRDACDPWARAPSESPRGPPGPTASATFEVEQMKQTLLNSAGAIALSLVLGAGVAQADDDNNVRQGFFNLAGQDFLNSTGNGNGSNNLIGSNNDNDTLDVDVAGSGNHNFNHNGTDNTTLSNNDNDNLDLDATNTGNHSLNNNGSKNKIGSGNDNDLIDLDAELNDVANDKSKDDNDGLDLDLYAKDVGNNKAVRNTNLQQNWQLDSSLRIDDIAVLVSEQTLDAAAAPVDMFAIRGSVATGGVSTGTGTNYMAAGNMTASNNTGAGTVAQAASGIQANGAFSLR